jgi:alpha-galactosidase
MSLVGSNPAPVFSSRGTLLGGGNTAGVAGTSSYAITPGISELDMNGAWTVIAVCRVASNMTTAGSFIDLSVTDRLAATQAIYIQHGATRALTIGQNGASSALVSQDTYISHPQNPDSMMLVMSKPAVGTGGPSMNAVELNELTHSGLSGIGVGCLAFATPSYTTDSLEVSIVLWINRTITDEERLQINMWLENYLVPKGVVFSKSKPPVVRSLIPSGKNTRPVMGWDSWFLNNNFVVDEATVLRNSVAVSQILKPYGYEYCILSAGWEPHTGTLRDASGVILPDATKFPNGIKPVSDYVRAQGLRFGFYTSSAIGADIYGYTGSGDKEDQDAASFANWNVEWLQLDMTFRNTREREVMWGHEWVLEEAQKMILALRKQGASTHLNLGIGYEGFGDTAYAIGSDSIRFGPDNQSGPTTATTHLVSLWTWFDTHDSVAHAAHYHQGYYGDCDCLLVGSGLTDIEGQSQFSTYAILMAPMICACELDPTAAASNVKAAYNGTTRTYAATIATLTNADVIAVNQDSLSLCGIRVASDGTNHTDVWVRPLANGDWAVLFLNRDDTNARSIAVAWADIRTAVTTAQSTLTSYPAFPSSFSSGKNLWTKASTGALATGFTAVNVPIHGCVMLRVSL